MNAKPQCKRGKLCGDRCIPRDSQCNPKTVNFEAGKYKGQQAVRNAQAFVKKTQRNVSKNVSKNAGVAAKGAGSFFGKAKEHAAEAFKSKAQKKQEAEAKWQANRQKAYEEAQRKNEEERKKVEDLHEEFKRRQSQRKSQSSQSGDRQSSSSNSSQTATQTKPRSAHEVLGVSDKASAKEIKNAYRKAAAANHPDVNKSKDATQRMQEINAAYDELKKKRGDSINDVYFYHLDSDFDLESAYVKLWQNFPEIDSRWWTDFGSNNNMYKPEFAYLQPLALSKL